MRHLKLLLVPAALLLSACGPSGLTKQEVIEMSVTPLAKGELPQCEATFGKEIGSWTQCISKNPTRFSDNGSTYEGTWVDGEPNGNGVIVYAGGGTYEGEVKNAFRHGDGLIKYSNGDIYDGRWVAGNRDGFGKFRWSNGYSFEGLWENNGPS